MIEQPFNLKKYNTFGFDIQSRVGTIIDSVGQLKTAVHHAQSNELPIIVIGGGSNIVLKNDLPAFTMIIKIPGIEILQEDAESIDVRVGGGVVWDDFVQHSLENHWYGLENLSIIPGTVGACPIQNVGAYGAEIKRFFHELTAYDLNTREVVHLSNEACGFQYRNSLFKNAYKDRFVITSVTFRLRKIPQINMTDHNLQRALEHLPKEEITPALIRETVIHIRNQKLPRVDLIGNAGSFFTNPIIDASLFSDIHRQFNELIFFPLEDGRYKLSAGWLIEKCGWKGYKEPDEGVGVYDNNALVLVNHGRGTAAQLLDLSEKISESVMHTFGVQLAMEPRLYA
jgi:UDP-N-acetylmuramate dehydrogenase